MAPGVIRTDMLDALPAEILPQLAQETPMGRLGTPEDIAHAVAFLASDKADFITGQVLTCDGGFIFESGKKVPSGKPMVFRWVFFIPV